MGSGTMTTLEWDETTWDGRPEREVPAPKTTVAQDRATITGEVEGEVAERWLMTYAADGTARFVGLSHVTGRVAGRSGTFVLQHVGRYDADGLRTQMSVVEGSGTDELVGLSGTGTVRHSGREGEPTSYTFEPAFDRADAGQPA